jgi:glycosyltransferase involved in cell wall biosynthesis
MPDRVYAVSYNLKAHIVKEGFDDDQVQVVYNGIAVGPSPDRRDRERVRTLLGIPEQTFAIVTVARLDPVKDLDVLIQSVALLNRQLPARLIVVGDGSERAHLENVARTVDVGHCVRFVGHREDARDLLAGFDVYANSSISEGISLTILEAMAAAIPVVATRVGGTPEILDETCGRLVPARDAQTLAAALSDLAARPDLREQLGRAARQRVETRFTLERMIGEYREAYYEAVA